MRCESLVERGGESGTGTVRARPMLQALAPRSRTLEKWRLMSYHYKRYSSRKMGKATYEQSLAESGSHFISEVVDSPTAFYICCSPFSL